MASFGIMASLWRNPGDLWRSAIALVRTRRETAPIDSVAKLQEFIATRSAYIAQKTLYGYVKTRMGAHYPAMFEDKNIIASLNIAKVQMFVACLSDLTVYAVATALQENDTAKGAHVALARHCYVDSLRRNTEDAPEQFSAQDCIEEFEQRLALTDWLDLGRQLEAFSYSPRALVRWAPIEEKLKRLDREVIENSVKFGWRDIRDQFRRRLDAAAVAADWARRSKD
jgi:hypothetical protein